MLIPKKAVHVQVKGIHGLPSQWYCELKTVLKIVFLKSYWVLDAPRARWHCEGMARTVQRRRCTCPSQTP